MAFYSNPSNSAQKYVSQIPGQVTPVLQPYVTAGQKSLGALNNQYAGLLSNYGQLQDQYNSLITNPAGVMNQIGAGYQESPGYQFQVEQSEGAEANRADAGGYAGTPQDEQQSAYIANQLANQDFYNYLNHALKLFGGGVKGAQGLYNEGLHGVEDVAHMGQTSASDLASVLAQTLMAQANLAYAGQANQNQHNGGIVGGILGLL
jgi:hypothetical protein